MSVLNVPLEIENKSASGIDAVPPKVWIGAIIVITVLSMALRYSSLNHHDNAWLLYAVGENMRGARLYVDLVEVNPPLIFFLYYPPVWAANLLSLDVNAVFYTYIFALVAISCCLCYRLLNAVGSINRLIVMLLLLVALLVLPRSDFGQREHLMVIFSMPFVFLTMRRIEGVPSNIIFASSIGLLAFFGFGLKPYFLLIPASLEFFLLYRHREIKQIFRPETCVLGLSLLGYIGVIFYVTPEYITKIIPMALEVYTRGYNSPIGLVIYRIELLQIIFLIGIGGLMLWEGNTMSSPTLTLLVAGCAAYVMYVAQMKGWTYHSYPALAFLTVSCGVLIAEWSKEQCTQTMRYALIFTGSFALLTMPVLSVVNYRYDSLRVDTWKTIVAENRPVTSFFILSSTLSSGFPLTTVEGLKWASRFPTLWMLPGIVQRRFMASGKPLPKIDKIERYHTDAVVEDMMKYKPELVFVDVRAEKPHYGGIPFEFIPYFSRDIRFKTLWSKYEKIGGSKLGFEFYRLKK